MVSRCACSAKRPLFWREAKRLRNADPVADARHAKRMGDRRLLALAAFAAYLPGLQDQDFESYRARYGVRLLAAGCVISSDEEKAFRLAASEYAKRYNLEIVAQAQP